MNRPKEWKTKAFSDCVESIVPDRSKQIQANAYLKQGRFPVVDQGQDLVGGWTDNESSVIREPLPLIIFGDHTRVFKYVDFQFALGADGTKVIKPDEGEFDPRFLYFKFLSLHIPSKGYSRHFKLLREQELHYPPLPEQRKIAAVLRRIQKAIELEEAILERVRELKKSTLQFLFTHGTRGEKTKQTEIGEMPESWDVRPFSELREFLQYGTSQHCTPQPTGIPVLRIPNIVGGAIDLSDLKYSNFSADEVEKHKLQMGDLLFVRTNGQRALVGRTAVYKGAPPVSLFASYLIRARVDGGLLDADYMQFYTTIDGGTSQLSGKATPAADGKFNINTKAIDGLLVPIPELKEQKEMSAILKRLDAKIWVHAVRKSALQDLFKTMLNRLMSGEIRVKELGIEE